MTPYQKKKFIKSENSIICNKLKSIKKPKFRLCSQLHTRLRCSQNSLPTNLGQRTTRVYEVVETFDEQKFRIIRHKSKKKQQKLISEYSTHYIQNISELPRPLLMRTISNLTVWHYKRIRDASPFFKSIHDELLMKQFRKELQKLTIYDNTSYRYLLLNALKKLSIFYIQCGYESIFCGCLLTMLRCTHGGYFCPDIPSLMRFIVHFLRVADNSVCAQNKDHARFLYALTLFNYLIQFPKILTIHKNDATDTLTVQFTISGVWLKFMKSNGMSDICNKQKLYNLIMALVILEIGQELEHKFTNCFECNTEDIIIFGYTLEPLIIPKFKITFKICSTNDIIEMLHKLLRGEQTINFECYSRGNLKNFDIKLELQSLCTDFPDMQNKYRSSKWCLSDVWN